MPFHSSGGNWRLPVRDPDGSLAQALLSAPSIGVSAIVSSGPLWKAVVRLLATNALWHAISIS